MNTVKDVLRTHLEFTFEKEGWQPSLWLAVQGLTADQAAWKPSPERHSIWQIVRHVVRWKRAVLQAWDGDPPDHDVVTAGDWKDVGGNQAVWEADVQALHDTHRELQTRLTEADDDGLHRALRWFQQSTQTQALSLHLLHVFTHDIYHAGQIQYLRALQEIPGDRFVNAAAEGNVARLRDLLSEHPDLLNAPYRDGWMALHIAAFFGRVDAVSLLLKHGANPRAFSENERASTALHIALRSRQTVVAGILLEHGADPEALDVGGNTALHIAAQSGTREGVELLLARGAKVNARNTDGTTPLGTALKAGQQATAELLRAHGAQE